MKRYTLPEPVKMHPRYGRESQPRTPADPNDTPEMKQARMLEAIRTHWGAHGYAPSFAWLREQAHLSSLSMVHFCLKKLVQAGLITYEQGNERTVRLTRETP